MGHTHSKLPNMPLFLLIKGDGRFSPHVCFCFRLSLRLFTLQGQRRKCPQLIIFFNLVSSQYTEFYYRDQTSLKDTVNFSHETFRLKRWRPTAVHIFLIEWLWFQNLSILLTTDLSQGRNQHHLTKKKCRLKKIIIFGWFHDLYSLFASKENLRIIRFFFSFFSKYVWYVEF